MPGSEPRLLALDGGGVRGLSSLLILQNLMEKINPDCTPKPCDYFDMIGGTSTGGLIAIMLGRLRMSVEESIEAYLSLSDQIFEKKRHRVTIRGKVQGRFDSKELYKAVKKVIKTQGLDEESLLKDDADKACKVTVCLTSYKPRRGNKDLWDSVKIWEACGATSAASSFFDPIAIGRYKEEFVDGGTGANNPIREMWDQAWLEWGPGALESKIKCLVSIGTGIPSLTPFKDDVLNIGNTLVAIATATGPTAEQFLRERPLLDSTGRYYRFNVLHGLENIGLEEATKIKEMAAATRHYTSSQEVYMRMKACADHIAGRELPLIVRTLVGPSETPFAKDDYEDTAYKVHTSGGDLRKNGRLQDALVVYHWFLQGQLLNKGEHHPDTAFTRFRIGNIYMLKGAWQDAEKSYQKAWQAQRSTLGERDRHTLLTQVALGKIYAKQDRIGEAVNMLEEALEAQDDVLPPMDKDYLDTAVNLSAACSQESPFRDLTKAIQLLEKVLPALEQDRAVDSPVLLAAQLNLGISYKESSRFDDAKHLYRRALNTAEHRIGYSSFEAEHVRRLMVDLWARDDDSRSKMTFKGRLEMGL